MDFAEARTQAAKWTLEHLTAMWDASRLKYDDVPKNEQLTNRQIAEGEHVKRIFGAGRTRVPDKDPEFFQKVCKRSLDATTKHPVIFMGNWRQGKSSLVNALLGEESAQTGRRQRTTSQVSTYDMEADGLGMILLADTPGLEPDSEYDIMGMYRKALAKSGCSTSVLTDLIVLVVAGTPQGISSLTSQRIFVWLQTTYLKFRATSSLSCTVLPVITHGGMIHESDYCSDRDAVRERLQELSHSRSQVGVAACDPSAEVVEPIVVTCPDAIRGRVGQGIENLRDKIAQHIRRSSSTHQFRMQWAKMLTSDLRAMVHDFKARHPDEETLNRLFHCTVEAVLATYQKKPKNLNTVLRKADWRLLDIIERKLRGEESRTDRTIGCVLSFIPFSPRKMAPFFQMLGYFLFAVFVFVSGVKWPMASRVLSTVRG